MRNLLLALLLPLFLAACGAEPTWAPEAEVQRAAVPNTGPTAITLITVISNRNGSGGHAALFIDASQHVLWDPAGSFKHPLMPERNDLVYGLTPVRREIYLDYHARITWHVVTQKVQVSAAVAEQIFRRAQQHGAVPKAMCASSISAILNGVPGFESIHSTLFPKNLMKQFAKLPGVVTDTIYDDDADDNRYVIYAKPPKT